MKTLTYILIGSISLWLLSWMVPLTYWAYKIVALKNCSFGG